MWNEEILKQWSFSANNSLVINVCVENLLYTDARNVLSYPISVFRIYNALRVHICASVDAK